MKTIFFLFSLILSLDVILAQESSSFKTSDGESLFYTKIGQGAPIIFLSGGPGGSVLTIQNLADTLSLNFQCILFHQRGTGLSSNVKLDSTTINLDRAVNDIEELREHLGEKKISLCGISWGGGLSQAYASKYPKNVTKMVLISTMGPDLTLDSVFGDNIEMRLFPNERDSLKYWEKQPPTSATQEKISLFRNLPSFFDHNLAYSLVPDLIKKYPFNIRMNELMWSDLMKNYNLKGKLKNYKGKCIIIRPRQDVTPYEESEIIKELLPQTKIIPINRSGHAPFLENPKDFYPALKKAFSDNF